VRSRCDIRLIASNAIQFFETNRTYGLLPPQNYPELVDVLFFAIGKKPTYVSIATNNIRIELAGSFGGEGFLIEREALAERQR
jgi:hypothetical protein